VGETALKSARAYRWLHGALFAGLLWAVLNSLSFAPYASIPFLVIATGAAALVAPAVAVAITVALITLPLLAADLVTGLVFLLLAVVLFPFLSRDSGSVFLVLAYGVLLAYVGPVWTAVALAGLLFGASEGAALAALTCITVQFTARLAGATHAGMVATGATSAGMPLLAGGPVDMLDLAWLEGAFAASDPAVLLGVLPGSGAIPLLVLQPLAWAAGAAVTGALLRPASSPYRKLSALGASAAGVAVAAAAHLIILGTYSALPPAGAAATLSLSLACALLFAGVREWILTPATAARRSTRPAPASAGADVEELLRLIATSEDTLAKEHATTATG
jgi:hypothetical protein